MATVFTSIGAELIRVEITPDSGSISESERLTLPGRVQEGTRHPGGSLLYLACTDVDQAAHTIAVVDVGSPGEMSIRGVPVRLVARGVQTRLDSDGTHLLTTHTTHPGLTVHRIATDGTIAEEIPLPDGFATGEFAHDAAVSPRGDRAIVVARGHTGRTGTPAEPGSIQLVSYDDGTIASLHTLELAATFGDAGFNPRNIAFHPRLPRAYVSLEAQNAVIGIEVGSSATALIPEFTRSLLDHPLEARDRQLGGSLLVHPNGRTLYAVTRADGPNTAAERWRTPASLPVFEGGENTISVFALDDLGSPSLVQRIDVGGISARTFGFFDDGRLLITANSKPLATRAADGTLAVIPASLGVFRIEAKGTLAPLARHRFDVGLETLWWVG